MTVLAEAIMALINSKPTSPRLDELEEVISQHAPSRPRWDGVIHGLAPDCVQDELLRIAADTMSLSPSIPLCGQAKLDLDQVSRNPKAIILYAHPLLLVSPQDDQRTVAGQLIWPRRLYIVWHDEEQDGIALTAVSPWGAAEAALPDQYERLMKAFRPLSLSSAWSAQGAPSVPVVHRP